MLPPVDIREPASMCQDQDDLFIHLVRCQVTTKRLVAQLTEIALHGATNHCRNTDIRLDYGVRVIVSRLKYPPRISGVADEFNHPVMFVSEVHHVIGENMCKLVTSYDLAQFFHFLLFNCQRANALSSPITFSALRREAKENQLPGWRVGLCSNQLSVIN